MKLLDRTLRTYLLYSALVMLISTPAFYGVIQQLFTDEIDEALWLRKEAIQNSLNRFSDEKALLAWRDLEGNTRLEAIRADTPVPRRDVIIDRAYREHPSDYQSQPEPFRELHATVTFRNSHYVLVTRTSLVEKDDLLWAVVLVQTGLLTLLLVGPAIVEPAATPGGSGNRFTRHSTACGTTGLNRPNHWCSPRRPRPSLPSSTKQ